jgi:lipopolysaccharide/colanic/teichoic acid biosynthesis glycosyltransferase
VSFPLVALLIKFDSKGPIIYKQKRAGKDQKEFFMYKYRTMYNGSDKISPFTTKKDSRITTIGKLLRKIHLDEVPQAINLLKGEVSLVGPRPEVTIIDSQACDQINYYIVKHKIRPGITGWAQTHFGYTDKIEEYKEKFEYDLYYLINRSFILDLLIILQTIRAPFETKTY